MIRKHKKHRLPKIHTTDTLLLVKMGMIFLCFLCIAKPEVFAQSIEIELPQTPRATTKPPVPDQQEGDERMKERRQKLLDEKVGAGLIQPGEDFASSQEANLLKAATTPGPMRYALLLSLYGTKLQTSGNKRRDYHSDPSVSFHGMYRTGEDSDGWKLWAGVRTISFQGSGTYQDDHGSFAFLYWGPSLNFGHIEPGPLTSTKDVSKNRELLAGRASYFISTGISAQFSIGRQDDESDVPAEDFDRRDLAFDSPGVWLELSYHHIKFNAISWGGTIGVQAGEEKLFYYAGLNVGAWH
jgi:hypothetical protein